MVVPTYLAAYASKFQYETFPDKKNSAAPRQEQKKGFSNHFPYEGLLSNPITSHLWAAKLASIPFPSFSPPAALHEHLLGSALVQHNRDASVVPMGWSQKFLIKKYISSH